jgi:hypothetical protein
MALKRFVLNEHLDVVLEDDQSTVIHVDGEPFRQCMFIVLALPADAPGDSIDEIIAAAPPESKANENEFSAVPPEDAFWAHCSNLQAWVEHGSGSCWSSSLPPS